VSFLGALAEFFFPSRCLVCGRDGPETLCARCRSDVRLLEEPLCERCGSPLADGEARQCAQCASAPPAFTKARGAAIYEGTLRTALRNFKYKGKRRLAEPLAGILLEALRGGRLFGEVDCLVPIPLHRDRERSRGYNQALLLAEVLGRALGVPVEPGALARTRPTRSQSRLSREERAENMAGAFAAPREMTGRAVLLVDDVMTTGATFSEAARVLARAGARDVCGLCVARDLLRKAPGTRRRISPAGS